MSTTWNVISLGRVIGTVEGENYTEALKNARRQFGTRVRVSAPGTPKAWGGVA